MKNKIFEISDGLSHVYFTKNYHGHIKVLCQGSKKIACDEARKGSKFYGINFREGGDWYIDVIKQWSIGAGHNSNCQKCLIEYLKKQNRQQRKALIKLGI